MYPRSSGGGCPILRLPSRRAREARYAEDRAPKLSANWAEPGLQGSPSSRYRREHEIARATSARNRSGAFESPRDPRGVSGSQGIWAMASAGGAPGDPAIRGLCVRCGRDRRRKRRRCLHASGHRVSARVHGDVPGFELSGSDAEPCAGKRVPRVDWRLLWDCAVHFGHRSISQRRRTIRAASADLTLGPWTLGRGAVGLNASPTRRTR